MISREEQKRHLAKVTQAAKRYGALLYMERPGDPSFLVPIVPELRGVEIVSASNGSDDGTIYDLWDKAGGVLQMNLTLCQVVAWLNQYGKSDEEFVENGARWCEEIFESYGCKRAKE